MRQVISDPAEIVSTYRQLQGAAPKDNQVDRLRDRIADYEVQIRRLARVARFASDDASADAVAREMRAAAGAKTAAEAELAEAQKRESAGPIHIDDESLAELSERVAAWLDPTDPEKVRLALEGLEVTIWAGDGEPRGTGSLPLHATCAPNVDAHECVAYA